MNGGPRDVASAARRKGSLLRTVKAVAWSFIGLRDGREYRQDLDRLNPIHIIAVAIAAVLVFVLGLVALVHWIV